MITAELKAQNDETVGMLKTCRQNHLTDLQSLRARNPSLDVQYPGEGSGILGPSEYRNQIRCLVLDQDYPKTMAKAGKAAKAQYQQSSLSRYRAISLRNRQSWPG